MKIKSTYIKRLTALVMSCVLATGLISSSFAVDQKPSTKVSSNQSGTHSKVYVIDCEDHYEDVITGYRKFYICNACGAKFYFDEYPEQEGESSPGQGGAADAISDHIWNRCPSTDERYGYSYDKEPIYQTVHYDESGHYEEISIEQDEVTVVCSEELQLNAKVTPESGDTTVTWTSSDDEKVPVNDRGCIVADRVGSATITATSPHGAYVTCKVNVIPEFYWYSDNSCNAYITWTDFGNRCDITTKVTKPATCVSDGEAVNTASITVDGVTYTDDKVVSIPKTDEHTWDSGKITTAPTCENTGVKTYTCKYCGKTKTESVPATGHKSVVDKAVAATCTTAGKTEGSHCSVCHKVIKAQTTVPAKGHKWDSGKVTVAPTDTKTGVKVYTCAVCGETKKETLPKLTAVTGISLNKTAITLKKGSSETLKATIKPSNAANKTVTWTSSNSKVATVANGKVTAVAAGTATITAKSNNGKTATCKVTVVNPTVAVTGIKLDKTALTLNPKGTATLKATITPSNATNKTVTWTSSNSKVATVSGGKVTAVAAGTATITAKSNNGKTAACKVTVVNPTVAVTGIKLDKTALTLNPKGTATLKATITPSNATNKTVTWTSSNSKVATVSGGKVTAVAAGTATITAKSNNGKTATCKVTVVNPTVAVTGIKLNKTALTLNPKGTATLKATITPSNATNKTVTWTTSNSKVATVSNGKVTAVAAGTATITAKSNNGKTATCKVTVVQPAKAPVTEVFSDVPANAWYVNAVQYVYDNGIMAGTGSEFLPNATMTRAMVVQTLYNLSGAPKVSGTSQFPDVKTTDWYCKAVLWAEKNKVAAGSDGLFLPNALVTREQFAQFLYNYAGTPKVSGELRGFADTASVSGWAKKAITWANKNGIISGKPSGGKLYLDPKGKATRAEAAAMLMKYKKM